MSLDAGGLRPEALCTGFTLMEHPFLMGAPVLGHSVQLPRVPPVNTVKCSHRGPLSNSQQVESCRRCQLAHFYFFALPYLSCSIF